MGWFRASRSRLLRQVSGLTPITAGGAWNRMVRIRPGPLTEQPVRGVLRRLLVALTHPRLAVSALVYGLGRAWELRSVLVDVARHALRLRAVAVRPWVLVVHRFMSRDEVATPLGRERLDACMFRVPIDGRMVSMCELNATDMRLRLNLEQRGRRTEEEAEQPTPATDGSVT